MTLWFLSLMDLIGVGMILHLENLGVVSLRIATNWIWFQTICHRCPNPSNYSYSSSDNDYSNSGEYATLKEWYNESPDAQKALKNFKEECEQVGPTDISTVGTDTLEMRITIEGLDDDAAQDIFTDSVQKMFGLDAHLIKEQVSGPVKFHVIGQNENGKVCFDETYQG